MANFGENLRNFRNSKPEGSNLDTFYGNLGVSGATGSRYENGKTLPDLAFLQALAERYPGEVSHLLPGRGVTGALPEHVERAYFTLCEVLDLKKATPADVNRTRFARILGKAARAYAAPGADPEEIRRELVRDVEAFLEVVK